MPTLSVYSGPSEWWNPWQPMDARRRCSALHPIRRAKDAPKFKDYILPVVFTKRLCDVFDDEINCIAHEVGTRTKAFKLVKADKKLVRFYLPLVPKNPDDAVWSVIRTLADKIGEALTTFLRAIADANPLLKGIIDRIDFNATTHGQRDIEDLRLSNLIEAISGKWLGLRDVEPDIIGRSYEYLIWKFAEGGGQSASEFYTPGEVGLVMARTMEPEPGMEVYDPTCGSASSTCWNTHWPLPLPAVCLPVSSWNSTWESRPMIP